MQGCTLEKFLKEPCDRESCIRLHEGFHTKLDCFRTALCGRICFSREEPGYHIAEMENREHLEHGLIPTCVLGPIMLVQQKETCLCVLPNSLIETHSIQAFVPKQRTKQLNNRVRVENPVAIRSLAFGIKGCYLQKGKYMWKSLTVVIFDIANGTWQPLTPAKISRVLLKDLCCLYGWTIRVVQHHRNIFTDLHEFGLLSVGSCHET